MDAKRYSTNPFLLLAVLLLAAGKLFAAPVNDNLANAEVMQIPETGLSVQRSNVGATPEPGEFFHSHPTGRAR